MDIFDFLSLIGGLSLFLFGMNVMGQALERRAGGSLRRLLGKMTTKKTAGLLTGLGVTAIVQSSSAVTVMVVGFVNSGLMTLGQAVNVIMGANIGTTVTAWILSLAGIDSGNFFVRLLKPSSFTPILALAGAVLYIFCRSDRKKDTGTILLGFATLMFGMEAMSGAVSGLQDAPGFRNIFILFKNPLLGVLAGAVLTAVIQSSSASVGILQALAVTGQVSYGAAIPIIMGQNIGTCVTALISALGTNKNAKRAAMVHLSFNVIGTSVWLTVFCVGKALLSPALLDESASLPGIAAAHSVFNVLCTILMLPMSGLLEKLVCRLVPDDKTPDARSELDERLLTSPPIALERCRAVALDMARCAMGALTDAVAALSHHTPELADRIREAEERADYYEDILGSYLVKLSAGQIGEEASGRAAELLKVIGDFERISDHAVNILEAAEELEDKELSLSTDARREMNTLTAAVEEISELAMRAFMNDDLAAAEQVEPLEQVVDLLKETFRTRHIQRLQRGKCSIPAGFVWNDLLTDLERISDHCSNIAGCVMDSVLGNLNIHGSVRAIRGNQETFMDRYRWYLEKYVPSAG